jgi:hypothetical protein
VKLQHRVRTDQCINQHLVVFIECG